MTHNKKYYGNAVHAMLETITEMYCACGEDEINELINMLNSANAIAEIWDLNEIDHIKRYSKNFNEVLASDNSKYRVLNQDHSYILVVIV